MRSIPMGRLPAWGNKDIYRGAQALPWDDLVTLLQEQIFTGLLVVFKKAIFG